MPQLRGRNREAKKSGESLAQIDPACGILEYRDARVSQIGPPVRLGGPERATVFPVQARTTTRICKGRVRLEIPQLSKESKNANPSN